MLTNSFGKSLIKAKVTLVTTSKHCLEAFIQLLQQLKKNNNLKSLFIHSDPRTFKKPAKIVYHLRLGLVYITDELLATLKECLPKFNEFSMGCGPNLPSCSLDHLLMSLNTSASYISLCSFELKCSEILFNPVHLQRFSKLQMIMMGN
ncbi:uncharacterized protein isoform X2 [Leptinotarsa decemlineata]|uniref:uncharacterized protein isoform X2 n=1 Tax=Leptinotarsa decemlineata TaxID=7539 RepID=UPI003D307D75